MKFFSFLVRNQQTVIVPHLPPGKYLMTICTNMKYNNPSSEQQSVGVTLLGTSIGKRVPANTLGTVDAFSFAYDCRITEAYPECYYTVGGQDSPDAGSATVFISAERLSD